MIDPGLNLSVSSEYAETRSVSRKPRDDECGAAHGEFQPPAVPDIADDAGQL